MNIFCASKAFQYKTVEITRFVKKTASTKEGMRFTILALSCNARFEFLSRCVERYTNQLHRLKSRLQIVQYFFLEVRDVLRFAAL